MSVSISVICPVMNEGDSIRALVDALAQQTRPADEIIFVDGGSTDDTVQVLQGYATGGLPIRIVEAPGKRIAASQNVAICEATHDVIASIHAGCIPESRWLELLTRPFEEDEKVDVVMGWYDCYGITAFEKDVATYFVPESAEVTFAKFEALTTRSMAFTRQAWRVVDGFPEWLISGGEDGWFTRSLRRAGLRHVLEPQALVHWRQRGSYGAIWKQFSGYARGHAHAGIPLPGLLRSAVLYPVATGVAAGLGARKPKLLLAFAGLFALRSGVIMRRRAGRLSARAFLIHHLIRIASVDGYLRGRFDLLMGRVSPPPQKDH